MQFSYRPPPPHKTRTKDKNEQRDIRKLLGVTNMSIASIVVMASWVYTYVQTHQTVYVKYVQVFCTSIILLFLEKCFSVKWWGWSCFWEVNERE